MKSQSVSKIEKLLRKNVKIPNPECVEIGAEVDVDRISGDGVVISSGCKIFGSSTLILRGVKLGYEGPVTIEDCQIGPEVDLNGGFFRQAVFLKKARAGSDSHIREGTIFEEEANTAHNVGLKQTILFPFVTLGSLINFCDCFMSGGTSRQDHSEVGSSYVHFNYTPNQDKATPSLLGDVPGGVMLNQRPIVLGGQGGLVGPCRLAYGTIIAAGSICRKDVLEPNRLVIEGNMKSGSMPFFPNIYHNIKRITLNNTIYIANLIALEHWYTHVRSQFIADDFPKLLFDGLIDKLNMAIDERIKRFKALSQKMPDSIKAYQNFAKDKPSTLVLQQKQELYERWTELKAAFDAQRNMAGKDELRDEFMEKIQSGINTWGKDYILVIKGLQADDAAIGTRWLQAIVDDVIAEAFKLLPSFT